MLRYLAVIGMMLVLGTCANVGVAWALALSVDPLQPQRAIAWSHDESRHWSLVRLDRPGSIAVFSVIERRRPGYPVDSASSEVPPAEICPRWMGQDLFVPADTVPTYEHRFGIAYGWPLLSLCYTLDGHREVPPYETSFREEIGGFDVGLSPTKKWDLTIPRLLPLRPILPGFVLGSLLYSLGMLTLVVPVLTRQAVRKRRGCCLECGFDMSHHVQDRCPECGHERR